MRLQSLYRLLFAAAILFPAAAGASEQSLLYYILDGSGSMWGRVGGKMKIEAAKEVMAKLIEETPTEVHGGLMVYGHRKKGDCTDIEEIIPVGEIDKASAVAKINSISPKGMTPISDSITQAAEKIKATEYATTIVLVSDGIETCDKDPCEVTKALKSSGINFVMHVVGFGLSGGAAKQLECVAEAGGGRYLSTRNATELLQALNSIKKAVVEKEALPPPPTPTPEPTPVVQQISKTSKSIRIKATGPGRVTPKPASWVKAPYYWTLVSPETGEEKARFRSLDIQVVPPGEYQIVWHQDQHGSSSVTLGEVITVEAGKTTEVSLKTAIKPVLPDWVKEPRFWGLENLENNRTVASFRELAPQLVPSGQFRLVWQQSEHGATKVSFGNIVIEPDKTNSANMTTALNLVPADWVPKEIRYWGIKLADSADWAARFRDNFDPQLVPPGTYQVIYRADEHRASNSYLGDVTIRAGAMNEFAVNTGVKFIPQPGMEPPYRVDFIELDQSGKTLQSVRLSESFQPMPLKPGTYKITLRQKQHEGGTVTLVESFELPAGVLAELEL